ncbi:MAG: DNA adenine methylase, partial [Pyrinomonadaceae bacterium]
MLDFIGASLDSKNIEAGRAFDAFSGTASVGRYLKARGFEVISADIMTYSFVFQKAYVELDVIPTFERLIAGDPSYRRALSDRDFRTELAERFGSQEDLFKGTGEDDGLRNVLGYLERCPRMRSFIAANYAPT